MGALGDEVSLGSNSVQTRAANDPSVFTITEKCLKCESASKCFQPGGGPNRGLLRHCENRWIVCSSSPDWAVGSVGR